MADRFLRRFPDPNRMERSAGPELAVRAHVQLGSHDRANEALEQLRQIATRAAAASLAGRHGLAL
ncbi:MAG TPA: hypothetical protein VG452_13810 [Egibacteraceae bacterium]|nr:hypothetical protein [Egibacteraceae bacterium]